jgi:hypothetical protein
MTRQQGTYLLKPGNLFIDYLDNCGEIHHLNVAGTRESGGLVKVPVFGKNA